MKLEVPSEVTQKTESDEAMDFYDAQINRSNEFWNELEQDFFDISEETEDKRSDAEVKEDRERIKKRLLERIGKIADAIAARKCFDLPTGVFDEDDWNDIKFILAFNTSFDYFPEKEDDGELSDDQETDYLDDETTFRHDVVKACDRLALEGAAFSKSIGSDTYALWADAMIKLGDKYEETQCKAADDIVAAIARTWADLRTWIFLKRAHKAKKSAPKMKKAKK